MSEAILAELSLRVAKLERTVKFLLERLQLEYEDSLEALYPDVTELKRQGKVREAIMLYHQKTNANLNEAKTFVDSLKV